MIALTREEKNHIANKKYATYAKKKNYDTDDDEKYRKVRKHYH